MTLEVRANQRLRRAVCTIVLLIIQVLLASSLCPSKEPERGRCFMVADRGEIYISIRGGAILAVNVSERRILWTYKNPLYDVATSPALDARNLYVWAASQGSDKAALIALRRATGEQVWSKPLGPPYGRNAPTVCSDVVVATDLVNHVTVGFRTATGALQWDTHDLPLLLSPPPTVEGKQIWYPAARRDELQDRGVAVMDCGSGKLLRFLFPGAAVGPWLNLSRTIFVVDGGVVLGNEREHQRTKLSFYDAASFRQPWSYEFPILEGLGLQPVISRQRWIGGDSHIMFIDLKDGRLAFKYKLKDGLLQSDVYQDRLIFRTGSHHVLAFATDRPGLAWEKFFRPSLVSNAVLCGVSLCVASSDGHIIMLDPENGRVRGTIDFGER